MWKTRFEVNTSRSNGLTRHRNLSSSSRIIHHHYSRPSPTVPRVREDSPSAVVRPSPPSSMPNLEILIEEDEDIPCTILKNNEQFNSTLRKQSSYQIVLPTIIESNDHEILIENEQNKCNESIDDEQNKYDVKVKRQDSFLATNTNYNQVINVDIERKERTLNTNKNNQMIEFTLDKRINELLQQRKSRQNKSVSSSTDIEKTEILVPNTFKDISAFFENKSLITSTSNLSEQKKMVRAKRSLSINRSIPINNNDLTQLEIISSDEKESNIFHHQIKRLKTVQKLEFDSIDKSELRINDSIADQSIKFDIQSKQFPILMNNNISLKKTLLNRWFILLLFTTTMFIYFYVSNSTNLYKDIFQLNPFVDSKEPIHLNNNNVIFRYGQFVRNSFFSSFDVFITFFGQLFFRIDKYQSKNSIVYVATSTYEHIYDWFIHLFK